MTREMLCTLLYLTLALTIVIGTLFDSEYYKSTTSCVHAWIVAAGCVLILLI